MATMEPKEFWEDKRWAREHYGELQRKYRDKWVAIVGEKVVSYGDKLGDVEAEAKRKTGKQYIPLTFVESGAAIY